MFRTILLELFLPFRPFKKTVNIRWTTISAHTTTKQNGRLLLRDKEARQLSTCLNRWLHSSAVTGWTNHWLTKNLKSLKNMICCRLMPGSNSKAQRKLIKLHQSFPKGISLGYKHKLIFLTPWSTIFGVSFSCGSWCTEKLFCFKSWKPPHDERVPAILLMEDIY